METAEQAAVLMAENQRLREENEQLLKVIGLLRNTVNRLIDRYISEEG